MHSQTIRPTAPGRASSPDRRPTLRLLIGAGIMLAALLVGLILWFAIAQPLQVLPRMRPAPNFALTTADGRSLRGAELQGRPALISFKTASCTTACAKSEELMRAVMARLSMRGAALSATLVSIDLDPASDTPAVLQAQAAATPGRLWLTGEAGELKALVGGEFGVYYQVGPGELVLDERVVLIDAAGIVRANYEGERLDLERAMRDLELLREEAGASGPMRAAYEASHLFLCYVD